MQQTIVSILLMGSVSAISTPTVSAAVLKCAQGGACALGDTGPGGGIVFYSNATGFNCGLSFSNQCNYLEVAPSGWYKSIFPSFGSGNEDPFLSWSNGTPRMFVTSEASPYITANADLSLSMIGLGLKITKAQVAQDNAYYTFSSAADATNYAPNSVDAYRGGSKSDWYLPVPAELNQLCKYSKGQNSSDATICTSSGTPSLALGLKSLTYYTSLSSISGGDPNRYRVHSQSFSTGIFGETDKDNGGSYTRPIRAFSLQTVGSVCFDATSPAYIDLNNANNAVGTSDFTLELWLKLSSASSALNLVNGHPANNGASMLNLYWDGQPGSGNGQIVFNTGQNQLGVVPASTWAHYAYVRTGSTGIAYTNGVPKTVSVVDTNNYTSDKFRIGYPISGNFPRGFPGCLAGISLTKSALYSKDFSGDLPYPSTRVMPANSVIFLKPVPDGFSNTGTGASPSVTGSVTYSSDLPIAKITPTLSWSNVTKTYGDASFVLPTPTSSTAGTWTYSSATTSVVSLITSTATVVGAGSSLITATFTPTDTVNYKSGVTTTMTVTVDKATPAFTWGNVTKTFGNGGFTLTTPTVAGSVPGTFAYSSGTSSVISLSGTTSSATVVAPGTSTITATFTPTNTSNYISGGTSTILVTVDKATPTFIWSGVTKTYGTSAFDLVAPTPSTPGTWTYSSATQSVVSLTGISATVAASGSSLITGTFTPTDSVNYVSGGTTSMTVTVSKATLGITASSHTVAFGAVIPTITPSYSGFVNDEGSSILSNLVCSTTYTTTTSVGTTGSSCSGATASNYSFSYTAGVITVTQSGQTSALTINSTVVTYGSTLSLTTLGGSGSGSNSFNIDSGPCTVSVSTLSATAAGTCMVTATKAANGNYLVSSSASTAITVNPKGLSISGLTGVNKEFDQGVVGTATGTPTLVGKVGSDNVLLSGVPTFTFGSANVANGITVTSSGYTLTGTTAGNYTLTQPTVTANITAKAAHVAATNTTVAFGAAVTSGFTTSGLISPDAVGSTSYTYTGTGTSTPPTAVGVYTVTPSNAVFGTGLIGNYTISYDTATVTILAKYTITFNANGGLISSASTTTADFVVGDNALTLPTASRANYTFTGWYTLQTNGTQVTGPYTPTATAILWARWVQNSLYGMGSNTKILTITTLSGVGNTYSANAGGGTIAIEYLADALAAGTVIDAYVLSDTSTATSLIGAGNNYVMSLVLAWVHPITELVETTATGKAITMTITNGVIKKGAKIYSVIGVTPTLLTTATADGVAVISITDDPQIIIAITKPDAPTGVSATSGGNASTTVSWIAPSDGGSAITSYTATSNVGQTCTSITTSCSVAGLINGTPYTFTVTATNSINVSDPSAASAPVTPAAPVVTPPSSGGGGSTYVALAPTADPAVVAAAAERARVAAAAKALADAKVAEEKVLADAKALADKKAADEAEFALIIKALEVKAAEESLAAAKKLQEELEVAAALKFAEEQRVAAEKLVAAKKITTVYSTSAAFKLNTTYTKRLSGYAKAIPATSTVTCIGYAKSSKTLSYTKAKIVASKQAKALCTSMKKINQTLVTKSVVYPASKAPVTAVNKKWIPVSYRVEAAVN